MVMISSQQQAANRAKWAEALRSGKYQQGTGQLRRQLADGFEYCCLGVACDLYAQAGLGHWDETDTSIFVDEDGGTADDVLPEGVRHWLGLESRAGEYDSTSLVTQNDDAEASFEEIATIIQEFEDQLTGE